MGHAFLSYARADRGYVERLAAHLTAAGIPVWYDYELATGDRFDQVLQRQIDACSVFVVVLTPAAAASKWVNREIGYADDKNKPILPLLLEPCSPPMRVHGLHREDVTTGALPGERFLARVRERAGAGPAVGQPPAPAQPTAGPARQPTTGPARQPTTGPAGQPAVAAPRRRPEPLWHRTKLGRLKAVAISATGLVAGGGAGRVWLWDAADPAPPRDLLVPGLVFSLAFAPDGLTLATGSGDRAVRLWDVTTGKELRQLTGHSGAVRSVTFTAGGRSLVSAGEDGTVRCWDVASGRPTRQLGGVGGLAHWLKSTPANLTFAVATDPAATMLAAGSVDSLVRIWGPASDTPRVLPGHTGPVWTVAMAPSGRRLASGGADGTVRLWDPVAGTQLRVITAPGRVESVAFSADGQILASGGEDTAVRLWEVATGAELEALTGNQYLVESVAFAPDGSILASAGYDGSVRIWRL